MSVCMCFCIHKFLIMRCLDKSCLHEQYCHHITLTFNQKYDFIDSKLWKDVKAYDDDIQIDSVLPFINHVVIFGRAQGFEQIWITTARDMTSWNQLKFDEDVYSVWSGPNYIYNTSKLRLVYSSLISPKTTYELDMSNGEKSTLKVQEVPLYDKSQYVSLRKEAIAADGRRIPMSLVFHKSLSDRVMGSASATQATTAATAIPTILYGYGR